MSWSLRFVTHRHISAPDVDAAVSAFAELLEKIADLTVELSENAVWQADFARGAMSPLAKLHPRAYQALILVADAGRRARPQPVEPVLVARARRKSRPCSIR